MIITPPPRDYVAGAEYQRELRESVYQMWTALRGNDTPILMSSTKDIDVTQTGTTELLTVDLTKDFVPTKVLIACTEFTFGAKTIQASVSFGGNSTSFDDFLVDTSYTVTAADKYQFNEPAGVTELPLQTSGKNFSMKINTASDATTEKWRVDLFGYYV